MPRSATKAKAQTADIIPLKAVTKKTHVVITPPNFQQAVFHVVGLTTYCMNMMSSDNRKKITEKQEEGGRSKKGTMRQPKDFDRVYKSAMHISTQGWFGMPASAWRAGLISACRVCGFAMTRAKLALFVIADGRDKTDSQPLVKLYGKPVRRDMPVTLADGSSDILPRPCFEDWEARVRLEWDADQFSASDVTNLIARMGKQVGIGAGRHDSKKSAGIGFGTFRIKT